MKPYKHPADMETAERMLYIIDQTNSIQHFPTQCIGRIKDVCQMEINTDRHKREAFLDMSKMIDIIMGNTFDTLSDDEWRKLESIAFHIGHSDFILNAKGA
jgi:hypothetical protein